MAFSRISLFLSVLLVPAAPIFCQATSPGNPGPASTSTGNLSALVLGQGDELTMAAPDIEELDKRVLRVQTDGTVSVPMIGAIKAAGLSPIEFQNKLTEALKTQFRDPQVAFTSIDVHSKPVSVLGAVNKPGIQQADGRKTLLEMLSLAGGLEKDAGPVVRVARATTDASTFPSSVRPALSGDHVTAEVSVATLFDGTN